MKFSIIVCSVVCVTFLLLFSGELGAQTSKQTGQAVPFRSPIRYVIYRNIITHKLSEKDEDARGVEVLLDRESFSKDNLVTVFRLISNRYPEPLLLSVTLYTSLDDVATPEEIEKGGLSEMDSRRMNNDRAVFVRANNKAYFYLYFSNGDFAEVEIK